MNFVLRLLINAVAIWLTSLWVDGIQIAQAASTGEQILTVLVIAGIFGLVNALIKPIVAFFSLPLYVLTLGLFTLVVNALMLMLTGWFSSFTAWGLEVDGFWTALWGAIIISVVSWVLSLFTPRERRAEVRR
jgi:putative membrane protein